MFQIMTFDDLENEIGLSEIFKDTPIDEITQKILSDHFFDFPLCDEKRKFLRYFKKRCNRFGPIYYNMLRVASVSGNMDPYIVTYMQTHTTSTGTQTGTDETNKTGNKEDLSTVSNTSGKTTVRTPNLETELSRTGKDKSTMETESSDVNVRDGVVENSGSSESSSNGKNRTFGIAYPEANMDSLPASLDDTPSIDYASNENYSLSKNDSEDSYNTETTDNTTDTRTVNTTTGNETEYNSKNTTTQTGNETTTESNTNTQTNNANSQTTENEEKNSELNHEDETFNEQQGRNESVADILPRAIAAIEGTDCLAYLIKNLLPCFDLFAI